MTKKMLENNFPIDSVKSKVQTCEHFLENFHKSANVIKKKIDTNFFLKNFNFGYGLWEKMNLKK